MHSIDTRAHNICCTHFNTKLVCIHYFSITNELIILILVVVRVHVNLGNDKDADHIEDDIITRFKDILKMKSLDEASRILKDIDLTIIAAKKGHSVVLYVYCRTATELMDLYEMNLSGKLRSTIEQMFKQLLLVPLTAGYAEVTVENLKDVIEFILTQQLYLSQMKRLTVILPVTEYKKCRSYFSDSKYNKSIFYFNK